jgi:3-hydroxymyristoyl/3-hydroxydecanoyl-(acyl carrier protein) dehydratase
MGYASGSLTPFPNAGFEPIDESGKRFRLAENNPCFDGHFDGAPILPGIAHLALALTADAHDAGRTRTLVGLRDVRFVRPLGPGDEVEVVLTPGRLPRSVRFELRCRCATASSGLLIFAAEDECRGD